MIIFYLLILFLSFFLLKMKGASIVEIALHPSNIFALYILICYVIPYYYGFYLHHNLEPLRDNLEAYKENLLLIVLLVYLISVIVVYALFKKSKIKHSLKIRRKKNIFISIWLIYICCGIFLVKMLYSVDVFSLDLASYFSKIRLGNTLILFILYSVSLLPMLVSYYKGTNRELLMSIVFSFVFILFTGSRAPILIMFLSLLYSKIGVLKFSHLIKACFFLITMFLLISIFRSNSFDDEDNQKKIAGYFYRNNDQIGNTLYVLYKIDHGVDFQYGETVLVDTFNFLVPRVINPSKPISYAPTRLLFPSISETGRTINLGIFGRSYLEFGYLGILSFPIILLVIICFCYNGIISSRINTVNSIIFMSLYINFILVGISHFIAVFFVYRFIIKMYRIVFYSIHRIKRTNLTY